MQKESKGEKGAVDDGWKEVIINAFDGCWFDGRKKKKKFAEVDCRNEAFVYRKEGAALNIALQLPKNYSEMDGFQE